MVSGRGITRRIPQVLLHPRWPCEKRPLASPGTRRHRRVGQPTRVIGSEVEMVGVDHRIAAPNAWWAAAEINRPPASGVKPTRGEEVCPWPESNRRSIFQAPSWVPHSDASHRSLRLAPAPWDISRQRERPTPSAETGPSCDGAVRNSLRCAARPSTGRKRRNFQLCFQGHNVHIVSESEQTTKLIVMN